MTSNLRPEHGQRSRQGKGPKKFFCHFHESDSDHRTNQCPEKKKTLKRMESEKKTKLVGHITWPQTPQTQTPQVQYTQPSFVPTPPFIQTYRPPAFNYNYNPNWQPQPNPQTQPNQPTTQAQPTQEQLPPPSPPTKTRKSNHKWPTRDTTNLRNDHAHLRRIHPGL